MPENATEITGGRFKRIIKQGRSWIENRLPKTQERKDKETSSALETWIGRGLELIKQESYQQAIDYFEDEEEVKRVGFRELVIYTMPHYGKDPDEYNTQVLEGFIDEIAARSKLLLGGQYGLTINPEDDFWLAKSQGIIPSLQLARLRIFIGVREIELHPLVYQNMALNHAEEWLHGLQYFKEDSIAGVEDREVDVALYLLNKGVPLTPQFMARYYRKTELSKHNP